MLDAGVCDVEHTVHSDELFVMRWNNRNGQPDEGVRFRVPQTLERFKLWVAHKEHPLPSSLTQRFQGLAR